MRYSHELVTSLVAALALLFGPTSAAASSRLGHQVVPRSESIRLELDPRKRASGGSVHVELAVEPPTDSFRFHAEEMKLTRVTLRGTAGAVPLAIATGRSGLVSVRTEAPLAAGDYT